MKNSTMGYYIDRQKMISSLNYYWFWKFTVFPLNIHLDSSGKKHSKFPLAWKNEVNKNYILKLVEKKRFNALAIITGIRSNLFILDIDIENPQNGWNTLKRENLIIPKDTPLSITQGGGAHLWFRFPKELNEYSTGSDKNNLIDWRGSGGLIYVPPTQIDKKHFYQWEVPLKERSLRTPPESLLKWILTHYTEKNKNQNGNKTILDLSEQQRSSVFKMLREVANTKKGRRSEKDYAFLHWACYNLKLDKEEAWDLVKKHGKFLEKKRPYFELTYKNAVE